MSLIACCNGQSAFGNACNSLVSAKMEESALAGLPQTLWHLPRDLREYPQTPKQTPRDLREYPQTPRQTPRDLRKYPQTPKQTPRDLREYPQTPKQTPQDLREYPQTPKSSPKHLLQCCRHFQKRFSKASVETLCWFYSYTELTFHRLRRRIPHCPRWPPEVALTIARQRVLARNGFDALRVIFHGGAG